MEKGTFTQAAAVISTSGGMGKEAAAPADGRTYEYAERRKLQQCREFQLPY